jgi:hypothetical protein
MMKKNIALILFIAIVFLQTAPAQEAGSPLDGTVSYVTSRSVYVKFTSTEALSAGDTLYTRQGEKNVPALVVNNLSSISAVCTPLNNMVFKTGDRIIARNKVKTGSVVNEQPQTGVPSPGITQVLKPADSLTGSGEAIQAVPARVQQIKGRVSVATYSNFSNTPSNDFHRMRYTLSLNARNINDSRLSAETYISFVHKSGQWDVIKDNIFRGLKIYNLAVSYDAGKNLKLLAGRKINPKLSNMGAVDGLQAELKTGSFTTGILIGSRPHTLDYSFNSSLFQYGMFVSHEKPVNKGTMQTTVAFVDQKNAGFTDRRFTYVQHSNSVINNFYLFGSAEFDLYRLQNEVTDNSPRLSNLYLSLRYRILSNLSVSASYSARKNIIYYETFKSALDRLLESEMQQGYTAQVSYRPLKRLSLGANAGYRNRKDDPKASLNGYFYATFSNIPAINTTASLSATLLQTSYLSGNVYAASLSRDILKQKVFATITYRYQDYAFEHSETSLIQHTGELSLNWNIIKKLSLSANYEGTFDKDYTFNRVYLQLTKRF